MSMLRSCFLIISAPVVLAFTFTGESLAQVAHCTDTGCSSFSITCYENGRVPMCLNARYDLGEPSAKEEHLCDVAVTIMEKNCQKVNPQPCLVAEDRVLDRCFHIPTTVCLEPEDAANTFQSHPDACFGACDDLEGCN